MRVGGYICSLPMAAFTPDDPTIRALEELLARRPKITIITHHNPDGDALGSSLGFAHILRAMGHSVQVVLPNRPPPFLWWMPGYDEVIDHATAPGPSVDAVAGSELLFVLDLNRSDRVAGLEDALLAAPVKVMIDHHRDPQDMAPIMFSVPEVCATAELIYDITTALGAWDLIGVEAATCLYVGLLTDSGSFRFSSTTPHTMRVAAALMEKGVDHATVHDTIHDTNSVERMRLMGFVLQKKMEILDGMGAAIIGLTRDELQRAGYRPGDTEGFVNLPLSIHGIRLSVLAIERGDEVKLSFRSKGELRVDHFARENFDGGGHANAAGGRSTEPIATVIEQLRARIPAFIQSARA